MSSNTYSPSTEQGLKQTFENNFYLLSQQDRSLLGMSPAVKYITADGNKHNIGRVGKTELVEANTRNPLKEPIDLSIDNRELLVKRYTQTYILDRKDAREMIADPMNAMYKELTMACNRLEDRVIVDAATGVVLVGTSDAAKTSRTAAQDGVVTIDATSGVTYAGTITQAYENFINNNVIFNDIGNSNLTFACAGAEHTDLMNEDKFINTRYTEFRPVDKGTMDKAGGMRVAAFAGNVTGGISVDNPILTESGGVRTNLMMAPEAIAVARRIKEFDFVEKHPDYVNSSMLTTVVEVGAVRYEGVKIQIVTSTI